MPAVDKGNVYMIVGVSGSLIISLYDEGQDVTPEEFIERYRRYFNLDESRITAFDEPRANGCRLFLTNSDKSEKLRQSAIFVPKDLDEREARQTLADEFGTNVRNFDLAIKALLQTE